MTHKNVVRIHDLGEIDGIKYLTMPYVQGHDLATLLRNDGKMPIPTALRLARDIAAGLQAAHEAGIVHRDLKPANIMVTNEKGTLHALIMDFGISASADAQSSDTVMGTLEYMAPEQARGTADARADILRLRTDPHEMLTGPRCSIGGAADPLRAAKRFAEGLAPLRAVDSSIPDASAFAEVPRHGSGGAVRRRPALNAALAAIDDAGRRIGLRHA